MSSEAIRYDAMRLLHFLGFKEIPEFRVEDITVKYLRALDLPGLLLSVDIPYTGFILMTENWENHEISNKVFQVLKSM